MKSKCNYIHLSIYYRSLSYFSANDFTGSMIRGNFGHALKDTFCQQEKRCNGCINPEGCGFNRIFEEKRADLKELGFFHPSHPYLFHSVPEGDIPKNHYFRFDFLAFGDAASCLLEYIQCFHLMAESGFSNHPFVLDKVLDRTSGELLCDNGIFLHKKVELANSKDYVKFRKSKKGVLHLKTVTPIRVMEKGKILYSLDKAHFIELLVRRYATMHALFGKLYQEDLEFSRDFGFEIVFSEFKDWDRYSSRQKKKITQGGIMGDYVLTNVDDSLKEILYSMEIFHIGKNSSFGLGQIEIS